MTNLSHPFNLVPYVNLTEFKNIASLLIMLDAFVIEFFRFYNIY